VGIKRRSTGENGDLGFSMEGCEALTRQHVSRRPVPR
jgi:hypothetical protein